MKCGATATAHCCYLPGEVVACEWFNPALEGGFCSLMSELKDWDLVHKDSRYDRQRAAFTAFGTSLCGDYDRNVDGCGVCN